MGPLAGSKYVIRPWQLDFIEAVYATDRHGRRRIRTAVLSMGRSNGKTTLAAMLALAHLVGPEAESRGAVFSAANDQKQAALIFSEMAAIVRRVPWMVERVNIKTFTKEMEDAVTGSTYAALSRESGTKMGIAPSMVVYDELGSSESRDLLDALSTSMGKRKEPLMMVISTQASRDEAPLSQLIDYGLRCQRGEISDPAFHLTLHTAPMEADPWSFDTWKLANPALGDFCSRQFVEDQALRAQRLPSEEMRFRNLILNQRVDATPSFIDAASWKACGGATYGDELVGRTVYAGLDLGQTRDMSALVLLFARDDGGYDVAPFSWLPGETLREREDEDKMPYGVWARHGYLLTTPGRATDPATIANKIAELHATYNIRGIACDAWRLEDVRRELDKIGCTVELIAFPQTYKEFAPALDAMERLIVERKLHHDDHPVLAMAVTNARVDMDSNKNRKLTKKKSYGRIDPLVALCMAVGIAARAGPGFNPSALIG